MIIYSSKLGAYVLANRPVGSRARARKVEGGYALVGWRSEDGEPPTLEQVEAWTPGTLTDVEIATGNFKRAREAAPEALDRLKGAVWAGLVAGGMAPDEATAAGVGLVLLHGPLLAAFEAAGGHPDAASALYAAIASKPSTDALPWLTAPILAIFSAALTPGK